MPKSINRGIPMPKSTHIETSLLYKNKLIENIYEACSCCYDNTKPLTYIQKKEYIGKRVHAGHESILEHGKLAILMENVASSFYTSIIEAMGLPHTKWLEFYTVELESGNFNIIINGSIRAYKFLLNYITPDEYDRNKILREIINILTSYTPYELYGTNHFMQFDFVDVEPDVITINNIKEGFEYEINKTVNVHVDTTGEALSKKIELGVDKIIEDDTLNRITKLGFDSEVFYNIVPVMVLFRNMSRTATHQLVRHRNAITQESQRYVNAKNARFTIPVENYDDRKEYTIELFGQKADVSLGTLATQLTKVYNQLIKQGLKKEEARAFLPANVECGRLYMTFTYNSLMKFLELRTDPHAQFEIRSYANAIKTAINDII